MAADIKKYLDEVRQHLHLDPKTEVKVLNEITAHFQEKIGELEQEGFTRAAAEREAVSSFGEARSIARLMYEAFSRGSWVDAFMSFQPHLLAAALFATGFWRNPYVVGAALGTIILITIMGWRNGAPTWMYSWAGYAFFPLLILAFIFRHPIAGTIGFFFSGTGSPVAFWIFAVLILYYVALCWLLIRAVVKVARRDWLPVSLTLLPLPVLGIWTLMVEQTGIPPFGAVGEDVPSLVWDTAIAYFCFALGATAVLFIRARSRAVKAGAIIAVGMIGGALALRALWGEIGLGRLLVISACLLAVLLSPLVVHTLFGHEMDSDR